MFLDSWFILAADLVLLVHALFVAFVVFGLAVIWLGKLFQWGWVRNLWFRIVHLFAIGFVVLESWLRVVCPLTRWERELREHGGEAFYSGSFIAHWLHEILFYQFPAWVFVVGYTLFGAAVAASWFWVRPHRFVRKRDGGVE